MATKFTSSQVSAGADILAAQENAMRLDMLKNAGDYATSTGSADAYLLALDAQISAYVAGDVFKFNANFANTGSATLNVNSIGAKTIKKNHDVNLEAGDIESGQLVVVMYDGTNLQLLSPTGIELASSAKTTLQGGTASNADALHIHDYVRVLATEDEVAITNPTSTETTVISATVPGGLMKAKGAIRITCRIVCDDGSSNGPNTVRVKLGSTTLYAVDIDSHDGWFEFTIVNKNDQAQQNFISQFLLDGTGGTVATQGSATEDTSSDKTLALTVQMNPSTGSFITVYNAIAELMPRS